MEKNIKKNVYICITAVQQKLTQHCKSTILQLKKKDLSHWFPVSMCKKLISGNFYCAPIYG